MWESKAHWIKPPMLSRNGGVNIWQSVARIVKMETKTVYHIHVDPLLLSVPLHGLLLSQKHLLSLCLFLALKEAPRQRASVDESTVILGRGLMHTPIGYSLFAFSE